MDRERDRERGGTRSDVASLWIDFLLLPPKLEEHLAAGPAAIPTPPDLISMFLEQALVNQKSLHGSSSANNANKDAEPQGSVKMASRTASVLCERAARVGVAAKLTLSDIESSLPSQQHQFVLLKALIRHDESRLLLHQCNLHRWLIHKALQCHPVGSAAPNAGFQVNRVGSWTTGDDLSAVFHGLLSGNGDAPSFSGIGDSSVEEERASVEFLEQVLQEDGLTPTDEVSVNLQTNSNFHKVTENGGSVKEQSLSTEYRCQVMFDVAEVHFMRGRIRKAYDYFTRCAEALVALSSPRVMTGKENGIGLTVDSVLTSTTRLMPHVSPVPQDRLAGFLIACRMLLLGDSANESKGFPKGRAKDTGMQESCGSVFATPSPSQWAIISCEQSRWVARRFSKVDRDDSKVGGSDSPSLKENAEAMRNDQTSPDMIGRVPDERPFHHVSKRSRTCTYRGDTNGELASKGSEIETLVGESDCEAKDTGSRKAGIEGVLDDGEVAAQSKVHLDVHVSNGVDLNHTQKGFEVVGVNWEQNRAHIKDLEDSKSRARIFWTQIDAVKKEAVTSTSAKACSAEVELFVDLKSDPTEVNLSEFGKDTLIVKQERSLIQSFVEDILRGHLPWGYCLSVAKDPSLSEPTRSKLAACNLVKSVLEGAPVQTFLKVSDQFENSKDSVDFLMELLHAIKVMEDSKTQAGGLSSAVDSRENGRLPNLGFLKQLQTMQGINDSDAYGLAQRVFDLAIYVCSVIDEPWCWESAVKHSLAEKGDLPIFNCQFPSDPLKQCHLSTNLLNRVSLLDGSQKSDDSNLENAEPMTESDILMSLVQIDSVPEIEVLVGTIRKIGRRAAAASKDSLADHDESPQEGGFWKNLGPADQGQQHPTDSSLQRNDPKSHEVGNSWLTLRSHHSRRRAYQNELYAKFQIPAPQFPGRSWSSFEADVAAILRRRAFNALVISKDTFVARRFYEIALSFQPNDLDSAMMLWLLERTTELEGRAEDQCMRFLPSKSERGALPSFGLLEFVLLFLIEKELWVNLSEVCKWVSTLLKDQPVRETKLATKIRNDSGTGVLGVGGTFSEATTKRNPVAVQTKQRRLLQTLKLATTLGDLMPLCASLQAAASRNHFNEDVARLGSRLSQMFEELMCLLIGVETDGQLQGSDDNPQWRASSLAMSPHPHCPGAAGVPLVSKISNPRALIALACLTAGWLHRCHAAGLTTWPLAVERYGVLAGVTAGAALPSVGSLPYAPPVLRPVPPRVSPEFGRDLFGVLLEGIVSLPGVVEGDREKGHRWLQGLADLAFEDDAYVKALRLYLQAGAIRSAHYCDRAPSMSPEIFTCWVIQRMVASCRAIGAGLQAAVLCQCLPVPDHESAFRILQENTLIVDRDAAAYFECLWEVPILELLVNMHAKAGDEARVSSLIGLLQQPALNVHNPPSIRQAHICTMGQRFLQRLAGELL